MIGHTIMITSSHPKTTEEFFGRIFWKDNKMVLVAMKIYDSIKEEKFQEKTREQWQLELKITYGQYYYVLDILKKLGLIKKEGKKYLHCNDLIYRLKRFIEFLEDN